MKAEWYSPQNLWIVMSFHKVTSNIICLVFQRTILSLSHPRSCKIYLVDLNVIFTFFTLGKFFTKNPKNKQHSKKPQGEHPNLNNFTSLGEF